MPSTKPYALGSTVSLLANLPPDYPTSCQAQYQGFAQKQVGDLQISSLKNTPTT